MEKKTKSEIGFDYETIRITSSRIEKGLLAIPVALIDKFPTEKGMISVILDNNDTPVKKQFTPYSSSSRECRIGGLANWYRRNKIQNHDEIVIQFINIEKNIYRIMKEVKFKEIVKSKEIKLANSETEHQAQIVINDLSKIVNKTKPDIIIAEFLKLSHLALDERIYKSSKERREKENVPANIRGILEEIYQGHCQLTNYTFIKKNGKPYFEIHHIKENLGHHVKNLLVVCPNIHAQFTNSNKVEVFDQEGWLRKVAFNNNSFKVRQAIDSIEKKEFEKTIYF